MSDIKDKTIKGMMWSGINSFMQQTLGLLFSIVIARRLDPSDFGMVGMLTIFTAVATCLQDGGLVWAITNRKDVTHQQYSSVFWFNLILSGILYIVLFCLAPLIASYFGHKELVWLSRFVFLGIIFSSLGVVQTAYLFKQIRVKERAISMAMGLVVSGILGIILAYNGFSYWGIATQGILNIAVASLMLWIQSPFRPDFKIDWSFLKSIVPEGFRFVVPNIFVLAGENIFSVILGKNYTVRDVGNYSQAAKLNNAGYSSILGMMRGVSQPVLVQVRDDKNQYLNVFRKLLRMSAFVVTPIMFCLAMVSPEFIEIILTSKWIESAYILRILCIGGLFSVLNTMMTYFIMSLNKTKLYMNLGVIISVLSVITAIVASHWGIITLAYSYSLVQFFSFAIYYFFARQTHPYSLKLLFNDIVPILGIGIVSVLISFYSTSFIQPIYLLLVTRVLFALLVYFILMNLFKCDSYIEVKSYLYQKMTSF